jgi:hypothetical protein
MENTNGVFIVSRARPSTRKGKVWRHAYTRVRDNCQNLIRTNQITERVITCIPNDVNVSACLDFATKMVTQHSYSKKQ